MKRELKIFFSSMVLVLMFCFLSGFALADTIKTATVNASTVNLRSGPEMSSEVAGVLDKGQILTVLKQSGEWTQVKTSRGNTGWVKKTYLTLNKESKEKALNKEKTLSRTKATEKEKTTAVTKNVATAKTTAEAKTADDTKTSRGDLVDRGQDNQNLGEKFVSFAKNLIGVKYVWGGSSPNGFDCSGFVKYVYGNFDIRLERVAANQAKEGKSVEIDNLQPGDLVFFDTDGGHNYINHVGMYIGDGKFIHASSGHGDVVVSDLLKGFYFKNFMTAKRTI
ncbi:MAG: NlpC/P60 family protein [Clostridia bacterium]|nr:NlpC/P60 family protein [Clostridia bacterium]